MLEAFIKSPGAAAIRDQYTRAHCPPFTDKLGYGTLQAARETLLPHINGSGVKFPDYSSPGLHVGGFGNPPKDKPWAVTTASRCDAEGKASPDGNYVQFQVINVAGAKSWLYHWWFVRDKPMKEKGRMRTIIEIFKWTEQLPKQNKDRRTV